MNTTPNVADMVEIIERLGEWREKEAKAIMASETTISKSQRQEVQNATQWRKGEELLQYWGFSYGTVLGATFAAMHPHRVKRVVLDGVCSSQAMYSGYWTANVLDTDRIMEKFFESCSQAGPEKCVFAIGNTREEMKENLDRTLESLNTTRMIVPGSDTRGPDTITYSDVMRLIKESLYDPIKYFPMLAEVLLNVSHGDGSVLADIKSGQQVSACSNDDDLSVYPPYKETLLETLASISCTDGEDRSGLTKQDFFDYYGVLKRQSRWMADIWGSFTMPCWGWKTRPKWRFKGMAGLGLLRCSTNSFQVQSQETRLTLCYGLGTLWIQPHHSGSKLTKSFPIVVQWLIEYSAYEMADRFSNSVVLEQDSAGVSTWVQSNLHLLSTLTDCIYCSTVPIHPIRSAQPGMSAGISKPVYYLI